MQRLIDVYDAAEAGARRAALVSGTAGIGKTALATAAAERTAQRGATVLPASCAPDPDSPSPIAQILTGALPFVDSETRAIACAELDLLHASPSSDDEAAPAGQDYPSQQLRLLEGVARTVSALPTCPVLVVEDAQWADDSTLLLLRQLLRHPDVDRLLVVVTYRADEVEERREKAITRLAPRECTEAVHLSGLNEHEIRSLVRAVKGPQVVPALLGVAVALRDATNGNPFHIRALLDELPTVASIEQAELEQLIENLAPLSIRALVGERVARLTEPSQLVARTAATIARELFPTLLSEVCDLSVDEVYDAIDEATGAGLMVEDARDVARYEFAHPLVRNAIYFGTPDDERHRIHLRVAETMEAHNERTPHAHSQNELAKHFNAASARQRPRQGRVLRGARRSRRHRAARLLRVRRVVRAGPRELGEVGGNGRVSRPARIRARPRVPGNAPGGSGP